jgi:uncharacterized protein (TIGR03086 family)
MAEDMRPRSRDVTDGFEKAGDRARPDHLGTVSDMTEISERYQRLSDAFAAKVAAVPADKWDAQTPCPEWKARDLVQHMVDTQGMFLGFIDRKLADVPSIDDDPAAAWDAARAQLLAHLEDPATAKAEFEGFTGRSTFEAAADRFLNFDLVVHGWDLARATGQDETIAPDDVARVQAGADSFGEAMRGPKAFGPAVEPPPGADAKGRLLAFLGRQP